jgi:hypothetical protein
MADIGTFDALTALMTFVVGLLFTSLALRGLADPRLFARAQTFVCSYLASMSWLIFGELFVINSAFGSFMVLAWMWYAFFAIFLIVGIASSFQAYNLKSQRDEWSVT